jgi:hypothetical protein
MMKARSLTPSARLLAWVRAAFILKGTSFSAWCKANNVVRRTAEQSLLGDIKSENGRALVERILADAGSASETH